MAMESEREKFCRQVESITEAELAAVKEMPYRRALRESESESLFRQLIDKWKLSGRTWYPISDTAPVDMLVLRADHFSEYWSTGKLQTRLKQAGVDRIWELREYGASYERALDDVDPVYTGAEGFWTPKDFGWLIFASHESSVTIDGEIAIFLKETWPGWSASKWYWMA
jgi:hypothetical protein